MQLQNTDRDELQQILTQLDQALYNHQQWYNDLMRTLACRLPCNKHDTIPDAYRECRFGQWYYSNKSKSINNHPGFIAIGEAHQRMHQLVSHVLINLNTNNTITPLDYDNFANSLERLRLEIYGLKNEIEILLYNRDPLTMAINRITMLPVLREQQELTRRQLQSCCIAMVDIDLFKKVNDQHGHLVGDKVLATLAHYLIEHLRPYDKIFRFGGEEFLLCIQQVNLTQAFEMLDRIREEIAAMPFNVGLQEPLHITVSCGITILDPNATVEESIDHTDKALYLAKSTGRNRTQTWNPR
ncbi:MAG: diguanylate cyclase [Gammaproteobacteria bacterium]|nr:diguanylate cyclase [Gammaproteobacteria bacterium]